jgi:hypothetical protein
MQVTVLVIQTVSTIADAQPRRQCDKSILSLVLSMQSIYQQYRNEESRVTHTHALHYLIRQQTAAQRHHSGPSSMNYSAKLLEGP